MRKEKTQYTSLAELRADCQKARRKLDRELDRLHDDVVDTFMPDRSYTDSSVPYMRYVGYAMTAYKTACTVKKVISFLKRR